MDVNEISSASIQAIPPKAASTIQPELWQKEFEKAGASASTQARQASPSATLTRAEQSYFEELFPSAAPELKAYSLYKQDGSRTDSSLGSVVDRKG